MPDCPPEPSRAQPGPAQPGPALLRAKRPSPFAPPPPRSSPASSRSAASRPFSRASTRCVSNPNAGGVGLRQTPSPLALRRATPSPRSALLPASSPPSPPTRAPPPSPSPTPPPAVRRAVLHRPHRQHLPGQPAVGRLCAPSGHAEGLREVIWGITPARRFAASQGAAAGGARRCGPGWAGGRRVAPAAGPRGRRRPSEIPALAGGRPACPSRARACLGDCPPPPAPQTLALSGWPRLPGGCDLIAARPQADLLPTPQILDSAAPLVLPRTIALHDLRRAQPRLRPGGLRQSPCGSPPCSNPPCGNPPCSHHVATRHAATRHVATRSWGGAQTWRPCVRGAQSAIAPCRAPARAHDTPRWRRRKPRAALAAALRLAAACLSLALSSGQPAAVIARTTTPFDGGRDRAQPSVKRHVATRSRVAPGRWSWPGVRSRAGGLACASRPRRSANCRASFSESPETALMMIHRIT
jgi:hypothetical protein